MERQVTHAAAPQGPVFDEDYLSALRNSDPVAEDRLISHFSRPVRMKLRGCLRSPELAQDAQQETFMRVLVYFRSGKTLDHPASLPRFIYTVSHNVALELLRAHTRQDQWSEDAPEPADFAPDPESRAAAAERQQIVRRLLEELSEKDRQLLCRVSLEGEDKDLVCREFHVDRQYLRVLLYRARLRFKALLEAQTKADPGWSGTMARGLNAARKRSRPVPQHCRAAAAF
jgi:RNA polymerase sigma-70 factor, ECF subfamily